MLTITTYQHHSHLQQAPLQRPNTSVDMSSFFMTKTTSFPKDLDLLTIPDFELFGHSKVTTAICDIRRDLLVDRGSST